MEVASLVLSATSLGIVFIGFMSWRLSRSLREPQLVVHAEGHYRKKSVAILHIFVGNRCVTGTLNRVILNVIGRDERPMADQCRFTVDVQRKDGETVFHGMPGRWNDAPEPLVPFSRGLKYTANPMQRRKYNRKIRGIPSIAHAVDKTVLDLYPGDDDEGAGIFIKRRGDSACYGFNTGSYFWKKYRQKDFWIDSGRYRVTIRVRSGSYEACTSFELINRGSETDEFHFDLRPETLSRQE